MSLSEVDIEGTFVSSVVDGRGYQGGNLEHDMLTKYFAHA